MQEGHEPLKSYSGHDGSCPKTMVEGLGTPIPVNSYTYFN